MHRHFALTVLVLAIGCNQNPTAPQPKTSNAEHKHDGPESASEHRHGTPSEPVAGDHSHHAGHAEPPAGSSSQLKVVTEPSPPEAGVATKFSITIKDASGTSIKAFVPIHEKLVHLIVVREGLDDFAHLHPVVGPTGEITGEFAFPKSGKYLLFADHQPQDKAPAVAIGEVHVAGPYEPATALVPNSSSDVVAGEYLADVKVSPGESETKVRFQIRGHDGTPVKDLQPYLGAMGHLVIISADGLEYVHAHPLGDAQTAPEGVVEFAAHFPKSGIFKAWGQFQHNGAIITVPYVLKYEDTKSSASAHDHGMMHGPGMMRGPGMGMGPGMMNRPGMAAMRGDAMGLHALLEKRDQIERQVRKLPNGVETITESDDPVVAKQIREHVAAMYKRLESGTLLPMMANDPLFVTVFEHAAQIKLESAETPQGIKVVETSDDPYVIKLIQAHADVVDLFIANGMEEVHREHAVPEKTPSDKAQP